MFARMTAALLEDLTPFVRGTLGAIRERIGDAQVLEDSEEVRA
jgi:hypothetical protein